MTSSKEPAATNLLSIWLMATDVTPESRSGICEAESACSFESVFLHLPVSTSQTFQSKQRKNKKHTLMVLSPLPDTIDLPSRDQSREYISCS